VIPQGFSLSNAAVEWLVAGKPRSMRSFFPLREGGVHKGDVVQARVTVGGAVLLSEPVTVRNAPPRILGLSFEPREEGAGYTLAVFAKTEDPDGDNVSLSCAWEVNGRPAGSGTRLGQPVRRGDAVTVTVTASDGEAASAPVTVLEEVRNVPPRIEGFAQPRLEGGTALFRAVASDPDGDSLTFSLESAPPGMTIDPRTGTVRWAVPAAAPAAARGVVTVADGHGGRAAQPFTLTVSGETVSAEPAR